MVKEGPIKDVSKQVPTLKKIKVILSISTLNLLMKVIFSDIFRIWLSKLSPINWIHFRDFFWWCNFKIFILKVRSIPILRIMISKIWTTDIYVGAICMYSRFAICIRYRPYPMYLWSKVQWQMRCVQCISVKFLIAVSNP